MKTVYGPGFVLALVVGAVMAFGPAAAGDKVELRFKFEPNAVMTYRVKAQQQTAIGSNLSPGTVQKTSVETSAVLKQKVVAVSDSGASIELGFDSFSARQLVGGKSYPSDPRTALDKIRIGLNMSRLGELSGVHVLNPGKIDRAARRVAQSICQSLSRQALVLPKQAVAPGDSWKVEKEIPSVLPGTSGLSMRIESSYKFTGTEKLKGKNCARIEAHVSVALNGKASKAGVPIMAKLAGEGRGRSLVALDAGVLLSNSSRLEIAGNLTAGKKEQSVKTNVKLILATELKLK